MKAESKESEQAFDRYKLIIDLLTEIKDKQGIKLIGELIKLAAQYIERVNAAEVAGKLQRFRLEEPIFIEKISNMNIARTKAHDILIDQLKIVNRYLFLHKKLKNKVPSGGIYSLDPNTLRPINRAVIGDWADYLTEALARRGIIKITKRE